MRTLHPTWAFAALIAATGCAQQGAVTPAPANPPPLASKPTVGQEVGAVANNKVQVTFPAGGTTLNQDAQGQLDLAARLFRDVNPVEMFSIGYTDPVGSEYGNILLSARRAEAVKQGLVARGIPADRIKVQALGASELANSSDPNAPENRRVVIQWRIL